MWIINHFNTFMVGIPELSPSHTLTLWKEADVHIHHDSRCRNRNANEGRRTSLWTQGLGTWCFNTS
ncbi:hypothetical protein GBAR_LOCUS13176, partial [Geodia barretti]